MKNKNEGKIIEEYYIRILTPVHIGAAQEKHLAKDIDYIEENGKIFFLDEQKILDDFKMDEYINYLSTGNLKKMFRNRKLINYASHIKENIIGEIGTEIKTNIKNTLDNKPYIPGSSIKGAIRSVLLNKVKPIKNSFFDKRKGKMVIKLIEPFGKIHEDAFRYLTVGDSFFNESIFINTKLFNLINQNEEIVGGWKNDSSGGNSQDFIPEGFTFPYECIAPGSISKFRISFNRKSYKESKKEQDRLNQRSSYKKILKPLNIFDKLAENNKLDFLFNIIQEYTKEYINKEIKFFEKYSNEETDTIIEEYRRLLDLNDKAPLLRIGQGSGFHSISGDWQFDTHEITDFGYKNRGFYNGKESAKSRKLAFTKTDGKLKFYPMGFVQLLTEEKAKPFLDRQEKEQKERYKLAEKQRQENKEKEVIEKREKEKRIEEERRAIEEANRPKFLKYATLKPGKRYEMDAIVSESGYPNKVDVYVKEGQIDKGIKLDVYRSPLETGKVIVVEVSINKKKKVTQASFKRFK